MKIRKRRKKGRSKSAERHEAGIVKRTWKRNGSGMDEGHENETEPQTKACCTSQPPTSLQNALQRDLKLISSTLNYRPYEIHCSFKSMTNKGVQDLSTSHPWRGEQDFSSFQSKLGQRICQWSWDNNQNATATKKGF